MLKRTISLLILLYGVSFGQHGDLFAIIHLYQSTVVGKLNLSSGIFLSTDGGKSWDHMGWSNIIAYSLTVDPSPGSNVYYLAAGNGILKSSDGGHSWRLITDWHQTEVSSVVIDPVDNNILYAGTPYGVFKSTDAGVHWAKKDKGLRPSETGTTSSTFIGKITIDRFDHKKILIATENGIYKSTDGGESWHIFALEGKGIRALEKIKGNEKIMLAGTEYHGIFISLNGGKSWTNATAGFDSLTVYTIAINPKNSNTIYAGGYNTGVLKSTDMGKSWNAFSSGLNVRTIHSIAIDPDDTSNVYVGTVPGGVYKSTDGGASWASIGFDGAQVWSVMCK
ncbi:MAG: WD40/YVTN/BNR-like repeat-containing protein [Candidatus Kryptoniota bacterium]